VRVLNQLKLATVLWTLLDATIIPLLAIFATFFDVNYLHVYFFIFSAIQLFNLLILFKGAIR